VTLAVEDPVWLEAHILKSTLRWHMHYLIETAMARATELL